MIQLLNRTTDQRIVLQGTWEQFKLIQKGTEGSPGVRLSFYDGAIELLMPGRDHEFFSRLLGYLVMTYGVFALHHISKDGYERIQRSQLEGLEELDISLLSRCVLIAETNELEAIAEFRKAI